MLALNVGWLRADALLSVLSLWPVALIALGVDLLTRGRYRVPIWLVVAIVAVLAAFGRLGPLGNVLGTNTSFSSTNVQETQIDIPIDGARNLELDVETGVAEFRLSSTNADGSLLRGVIRTPEGQRLDQRIDRDGDTVDVEFDATSERRVWSFGDMRSDRGHRWDLSVARGVSLDLAVNTGVGLTSLDLRDVDLRDLRVNAGVGEVRIVLPESGAYEADIDAGVGEVNVTVPAGAAVRIEADTGIGALDANGFLAVGGAYETREYADAPRSEQALVRIDGGLGSINLNR